MVLETTIVLDANSSAEKYIKVPPQAEEAMIEVYSLSATYPIDVEIWGSLDDDISTGYGVPISLITLATEEASNFEIVKNITAAGIYSAGIGGMKNLMVSNLGTEGDIQAVVTFVG